MRGKACRLHMLHIILLWSVVGVFRYQFACGGHVLGQSGLLFGRLQIFSMKNILLFSILKFVATQSIYLCKKKGRLQVKLICRRLIVPWPRIARNFHRFSNIGANSTWLGAGGGGGGRWGVTE